MDVAFESFCDASRVSLLAEFQSLFLWMLLLNTAVRFVPSTLVKGFNPCSYGCCF